MNDTPIEPDEGEGFHAWNDYGPDFQSFEECLSTAASPRPGYWSAWAALAWIATRSPRFVAATQAYEAQGYLEQGGAFACAGWWVLTNEAAAWPGGGAFSEAEQALRLALETGALTGGVARERGGQPRPVQQHEWLGWKRSFENWGLVLVPGLTGYSFPSDAVLTAFPADGGLSPAIPATAPLGRPKGAGKFTHSDPAFVEAVRALIVSKAVGSLDEASRAQWPACGGQSEESAVSRLRRKYRKKYPASRQ